MDKKAFPEIGARLRQIRQGFTDLNQSAFAAAHQFNQSQYSNWENGSRRIPIDAAETLIARYGLSLDFIYLGRRDGLSTKASKIV